MFLGLAQGQGRQHGAMAQDGIILSAEFLFQDFQVGFEEVVPVLDLLAGVVVRQAAFEVFDEGAEADPQAVKLDTVHAADHVIKPATDFLLHHETAAQVHFESPRNGILGKKIRVGQEPVVGIQVIPHACVVGEAHPDSFFLGPLQDFLDGLAPVGPFGGVVMAIQIGQEVFSAFESVASAGASVDAPEMGASTGAGFGFFFRGLELAAVPSAGGGTKGVLRLTARTLTTLVSLASRILNEASLSSITRFLRGSLPATSTK